MAFISKAFETRNRLSRTPVACDLLTVGGNINYMNTVLYKIKLIDREGEHQTVYLYEIDDICGHQVRCRWNQ